MTYQKSQLLQKLYYQTLWLCLLLFHCRFFFIIICSVSGNVIPWIIVNRCHKSSFKLILVSLFLSDAIIQNVMLCLRFYVFAEPSSTKCTQTRKCLPLTRSKTYIRLWRPSGIKESQISSNATLYCCRLKWGNLW